MIKQEVVRKMFLVALLFMLISNIFSAETGDALQLLSYRVTDSTKPNVMDGQIAVDTDRTDWSAAYVRSITMDVDGILDLPTQIPCKTFIANDTDNLYISLAIELSNVSTNNQLTIYFDQGTPNILDGDATTPGEYYISLFANGDLPVDGHWDGNSWEENATPLSAAVGCGASSGGAGKQIYNFEFEIPLNKAGSDTTSYLHIQPGDEIRALFKLTMGTAGNDEYFWTQTNAVIDSPSATGANGAIGWAEIKTIGEGIADRNFVSLNAKGILPTIDGNISNDPNWKYSFNKNVVFTDYNGNKLDGIIKIKEEGFGDNLIFGIIIKNYSPDATDYISIYQDQGAVGGNSDFVLTQDNAIRIMGDGNFQDYNFVDPNWTADGIIDGMGAADDSGTDWEIEVEIPFNSGNPGDLNIVSDNVIGTLFSLHDSNNNIDYWLSSTVNTDSVVIDPVTPVFNALGWAVLQTGGPFVQSIYPENGDIISGEYPLAVYTVDPTDAVPELGIDNVTYEVRLEDTAAGTYTVLRSGTMSKVEDDNIPIWTATLDTRTIIQPLNTLLKLVYIVEDGEIDPVSVPLDIYINNEGGSGLFFDPDCELTSPLPHVELSGSGNALNFTVSTDSMLTIDSIMVFIDGELMSTYAPVGVYTYSDTYLWDTSGLPDGEHIIQIWGKNSLNMTNYSPSTLVYTKNSPSVIITSPVPSLIYNGIIDFDFTASPIAPSLLVNTEISIDGGVWTAVTTQPNVAGGVGSHTIDTVNLDDGTHEFIIRTTDNDGKVGYSSDLNIIIDNTAPMGLVSVTPENVKNGDLIQFEYVGNEPDLTVFLPLVQLQSLDDGDNATAGLNLVDPDMNGIYTASYIISDNDSIVDSTINLDFDIVDVVGNIYNPTVSITLDNTDPTLITYIYPIPVGGEVFVRNVLFDCSYFDAPDSNYVESIVIRHTNSTGDDVNNSPIDIEITDYRTFSRTLEMIDGTNNINVTLIDKSGNILSEDTALIYEDPRVTNIIGESGGIVTSPDGTIVDIPAGALLSDEEITIRTISTEGLPRPRDGSGILLLKNAHEFGPENLIFHEPVTITLSYNDFDLDLDQDGNPDITEADLEVFTLDGNTWIKTVADDNDEVGNLVRFTTNHFSVYALGTQTPTTDIKVYWTKNPFSANNSTTVVAELIDNGIVSLKIYDMSGDLVRVLADQMPVSGTTNIKWDGKNDYDNYVGSGIYIYVFEYENSTTGVKETIKKPIGVIK